MKSPSLSALYAVMCKELVDVFRDRRTLMIALLMGPLLFPALILGMGSLAEKRVRTQLESTLELPVIGAEHAPNLVAFLHSQDIVAVAAPADPDAAVRAQGVDLVLRIGPEFPERWRRSEPAPVELIHDSSRQDASILADRVEAALQGYGRQAGALRIVARGLNPQLLQGVRVEHRDLATPEAKRGQLLAFLPYLLLLSAFLGGAYLVIDVTAGERERQSLEPLLATPASREAVMSGKIAAACALGMLSLLLILLSFKLSFQFAGSAFRGVDVSLPTLGKLLLVLLPMVLLGTTLLTLISASVKSVKEAQSYMSILMLLPMIPTILLMVNPIKNQLWQYAVPFLAQNQLILKLVRSEAVSTQEWGVYLAASFGLGLVLWAIAARLYHREKLAISA
jgi:sodium transport system permease protein